jgi:hypothetical protein
VGFNLFSTLIRPRKKAKPGDLFELLVHKIEQSAPKEHGTEREIHYYNYRMVTRYSKPLEGLLENILKYRQSHTDPIHTAELFFSLKSFYDTSDHLTTEEALKDRNLAIKFLRLLLLFYNFKEESTETMRNRIIEGLTFE